MWPYLIGGQSQVDKRGPEQYINRTSLVNESSVHISTYHNNRYHHWVVIVGNHTYQAGLHEIEIWVWRIIVISCFQRHYC